MKEAVVVTPSDVSKLIALPDAQFDLATHMQIVCIAPTGSDDPCGWKSSTLKINDRNVLDRDWMEHRKNTAKKYRNGRGGTLQTWHVCEQKYFTNEIITSDVA
ncbi:MAG: hypothetical protein Q8L37_04760 [Candidatus Gottesmanbacteria bacterium]|nr:hypothetical protein [Candidatus Gottesmanbacteria bacterium]